MKISTASLYIILVLVIVQFVHPVKALEKSHKFGYTENISGATIGVDYRIEALTIIQLLAKYPILTKFESDLKNDILERFAPLKNHQAVKYIKKNWRKGVAFEKPVYMVLQLDTELKPAFKLPSYVEKIVGGHENYMKFAKYFADFYNGQTFQKYIADKSDFYRHMVTEQAKTVRNLGAAQQLADYYGYTKSGFRIVMSPLLQSGGYGPSVQTDDNEFTTYNIMGPWAYNEKSGFNWGNQDSFRFLVWHEFSHSYLNPIIDDNINAFNEFSSLIKPIKDKMKDMAYGSWKTVLYEHLVRAATTRLSAIHTSEEEGRRAKEDEVYRGFVYVPGLLDALKHYESHRDQYPIIDSLYPILIEVMKQYHEGSRMVISPDKPPYMQAVEGDEERYNNTGYPNINFAAAMVGIKGAAIIPAKGVDPKIMRQTKAIVKKYWVDKYACKLYTDEEALRNGADNLNTVAYGTPDENAWIKEQLKNLPLEITPNSIRGVDLHKGSHLRLVVASRIQKDPERYAVIYTAQQSEDIPNINTVFHGPTCYVIASGREILEKGFFFLEDDALVARKMLE